MTIRQKLYFLGVIAILGIVTLLGTSSHFANQSNELNHAVKLVGDLEIRLLNLRRNEKDFLLRSNVKYLDKFDSNVDKFLSTEKELSQILNRYELPSSQRFKQDLLAYQKGFQALVSASQKFGLDKESGILARYENLLLEAKKSADHQQILSLIQFDNAVKMGEFDSSKLSDLYVPELLESAKQLAAQKQSLVWRTTKVYWAKLARYLTPWKSSLQLSHHRLILPQPNAMKKWQASSKPLLLSS